MADSASAMAWRWDDYLLLPAQRRLLHRGRAVELEDRVFDLLVLLLRSRERALDRQEIISAIWGKRPVNDATLRQLVYKARRAVGDDGVQQRVIHTSYGRSVQWIAPVERQLEPEAPAAPPVAADAPGDASSAATLSEARSPAIASPAALAATPSTPFDAAGRPRTHARTRFVPGGLVLLLLVTVLAVVVGTDWYATPDAVPAPSSATPTTPAPAASAPVTLAVLPFRDMQEDADKRYLADGLTEELITRLGRFPELRVAARTSSFEFGDKPVDIRTAAQKLGVANVLEGSVQHAGERLRVRVALINARDGYQRWSAEYNPTAGNLLTVEDEIAAAVIKALHPHLDAKALATLDSLHRSAPADPAAHDFYLVGLQYLSRRTVPDIQQSLVYFKRALQADPSYALAWSGVASAYNLLREHNSDTPPDTYYAQGLDAANKAVALDPQLSQAHLVLALLHEAHWQWSAAEREFQRALQLDPSSAVAHQRYAAFQWYMRDRPKALAQMQLAHDLDPLSPIINTDLARTLLFNRQVDAAIAQFQATLKLDPGFALCHVLLAQAYMAKDRNADAVKEARAALALIPSPPPASYISVYGVALFYSGDKAGARQQLRVLETRSRQHYVSGASLALLQGPLGETDAMYANLARAVTDHDALMRPAIASRDALWYGDPRFKALLVKMGLPTTY